MKKALTIMFGTILFSFGLLGAIIDAIAQGDLRGKLIWVSVGIIVALFGLWLMRRVEKSYTKVFEAMLDLLFLNWP